MAQLAIRVLCAEPPHVGVLSYAIPPLTAPGRRAEPMLRVNLKEDQQYYLEVRKPSGWTTVGRAPRPADAYQAMADQNNEMLAATYMKRDVWAKQANSRS